MDIDGQLLADNRHRRDRGQRTERDPGHHADASERHYLDHIYREYHSGRRAQTFHGRDRRLPGLQERAHRISDTDTADQQCRQPDNRHEDRDPVDGAAEARRRIARISNAPPGLRKRRVDLLAPGFDRTAVGDTDAIVVADQAPRLHQPALVQGLEPDEHALADRERTGGPVRLPFDRRGDPDRDIADLDATTDVDIEFQQ